MSKRSFHIDGVRYVYAVGRRFVVLWVGGRKSCVFIETVTGETVLDMERARDKHYWRGVTSSQVKRYVIANLDTLRSESIVEHPPKWCPGAASA